MLSVVSAKRHFRFITLEGRVNGEIFREPLKRLITDMQQKVFLVFDGHPAHKAKLVRRFVQDNADRLGSFFLLPYSPELNPDELVWAHVKTRAAKATTQTKDEPKRMLDRALRRFAEIAQHRRRIFFHASTCRYASN